MRGSDEVVDVLVVGCGPVGGVLGAPLGLHGVSTVVVDPDGQPYPLPRAAALDAGVLRTLPTLPGLTDIAGRAAPLRRSGMVGPGWLTDIAGWAAPLRRSGMVGPGR